jgi:SagB-type dehydrogenase family enzyme
MTFHDSPTHRASVDDADPLGARDATDDLQTLNGDDLPRDIRGYHQRTKHAPNRYALGPAFLDWTSQPSPYRSFAGSPRIMLPLRDGGETPSFPGPAPRAARLDRDALGLFLELAFGISAWKSVEGATWALRNNPSSGNLHPTEAWLILGEGDVGATGAAIYHYAPLDHALETRAEIACADGLPRGGFLLALGSIPWREAWKYGERAFRYCQLDAGHAVGAAAQAAAALGWRAHVLAEPSDDEIAALLGLKRDDAAHRHEPEHPELLAWIEVDDTLPGSFDPRRLIDGARVWRGTASRLSEDHDGWPLVDLAFRLCRKPRGAAIAGPAPKAYLTQDARGPSVAEVVRGRRSAQRFDGKSILPRAAFDSMLAATMPGAEPLLAAFPWPAALTLVLFVHRVEGLEPGLYLLARDAGLAERLRAACSQGFDWTPVDPGDAPLFRLRVGDVEREAARLACLQAISGKGCFSLAMIADFDRTLDLEGAFAYRRLHWEAGLIGQALYLCASARGFSGTGIGCFFDDEVHALLGLAIDQTAFQDIYHFTVGAPVEDARILTLPPYPEERRIRP